MFTIVDNPQKTIQEIPFLKMAHTLVVSSNNFRINIATQNKLFKKYYFYNHT